MLGETNGQYNEHCLPLMHDRDLTICTYFTPKLTPPPAITLFAGNSSLIGFFRALRAALKAKKYDVVHVHAPQSGGLVLAATMAWGWYRRLRRRLVYTVQDSFYDYSRRNQLLTLVSLLGFDRVIFCSHAALASIPEPFRRMVKGKSRVVPNAADIDRVDRSIQGIVRGDGAPSTVAWVGRMEPVKDPSVAISAFASALPNSQMVMVGAGSMAETVASAVRAQGLGDRIELTGLIPREEVFAHCARADLFLSVSHGEGMPVAVIEAMATECPVVLSDIPPHRELAEGAPFIPLVPVGDVEGFAREIRRFWEMTPEERSAIGRRSRAHVVARYSLPTMHAGVEEVYRRDSPAAAPAMP